MELYWYPEALRRMSRPMDPRAPWDEVRPLPVAARRVGPPIRAAPSQRAGSPGQAELLATHLSGWLNFERSEWLPNPTWEINWKQLRTLADMVDARRKPFPTYNHSFDALYVARSLAPFRVRSLLTWEPPENRDSESLLSLVYHLFAKHPVPRFLENAWVMDAPRGNLKWIAWYILLGQGAGLHQSARHFSDWEIARTYQKWLHKVPPDFEPRRGAACAEVLRLGGSIKEYERLEPFLPWDWRDLTVSLGRRRRRLLGEAIRWLARYRDELTDDMSEVVLAWAMWRITQDVRRPFAWKGRTPVSAHRAALQHRRWLDRQSESHLKWEALGWYWKWRRDARREWSMVELTTAHELHDEGRAMHHCVGEYSDACSRALTAIFSLRMNGERRVTVSVDPWTGMVLLANGLQNRPADTEEQEVIARWQANIVVRRAAA